MIWNDLKWFAEPFDRAMLNSNFGTFIMLTILLFQFCNLINADSGNYGSFTNLICKSLDPSFIKFSACRLRAINRSTTLLTVRSVLLQPPVNDAKFKIKFYKRANGYKPFPIDVTVDLCSFLSGRNVPIFKPFYEAISRHTNVNRSCPLPEEMIIENLPLPIDVIPSTWPEGEFRVDTSVFSLGIQRTIISSYVSLKEKIKTRKKGTHRG